MHTSTLFALAVLIKIALSIDLNNVASDVGSASDLLNNGVSSIITPVVSAMLPQPSTFQRPSPSPLSSALSSYADTAKTAPDYLLASSYLASTPPLPNASDRASQDSSYTHALATAANPNTVALPPYYNPLPSSIQSALGAYASSAQTLVSAVKASPSVLVFNPNGNSTLNGVNGTVAGGASASGSGTGTAPAGTGTGINTVTSIATATPPAPTPLTTSSSSSSASSSSSKAGAVGSQPTGAVYKVAGAAAVGVAGLAALL